MTDIDVHDCRYQAICSVCGTRYGPYTKPKESHGYCPPHAEEAMAHLRDSIRRKKKSRAAGLPRVT